MIGVVLAAGPGRRLHPLTYDLPKPLLPVNGDDTMLDLALSNLTAVGIKKVILVVGFGASHIQNRVAMLSKRHKVTLRPVYNHRSTVWDSAFSFYLGLEKLNQAALICNGDTVHPVSVEQTLLAARGPQVLLAVDDRRTPAQDEVKVVLTEEGQLQRIVRGVAPATARGTYIGVALVERDAVPRLRDIMDATWRANNQAQYEDGIQNFADDGGEVRVAPIGAAPWVEVVDHDDLTRAREMACS